MTGDEITLILAPIFFVVFIFIEFLRKEKGDSWFIKTKYTLSILIFLWFLFLGFWSFAAFLNFRFFSKPSMADKLLQTFGGRNIFLFYCLYLPFATYILFNLKIFLIFLKRASLVLVYPAIAYGLYRLGREIVYPWLINFSTNHLSSINPKALFPYLPYSIPFLIGFVVITLLLKRRKKKGGDDMSKWVIKKEAKWLHLLHSTSERRLVTVASGSPIEVIPIGEYREWVPLIRKYDSLAFVSMGPKQVDVGLKGNAGTSDGVTVEGKVSVQVTIRDEESCIKRIAADSDEEERLLSDSILTAVQETIASHTWHQMMSIGERFAQTAEQKLSELLLRTASCFAVTSLTIQKVRPQNNAFAESLEKAARAKEDERLQKDLTQLRAEREALERKAKEEELESKLQMQKLEHCWELGVERDKLKLEQEKDDAEISTQKKTAELLQTEAGRIAWLPEEMFEHLAKELELKITDSKERQKLIREMVRFSLSPLAGEVRIMKAFLAQQYGVRFSEESPMLAPSEDEEEEKETQQINDKTKDSDDATERR